MEKELIKFILDNELSPFNRLKTRINGEESVFKTKDAKAVHSKVLGLISNCFVFPETSNIFNFFHFTSNPEEIKKRQEFFKSIKRTDNQFLKQFQIPKQVWKPNYDLVVATEDEGTLIDLQKLGCPVQYITCEEDIAGIANADIIQVIDCENFSGILERLPQTVFINRIEDVYLERFLTKLSGWKSNVEVLQKNPVSEEITQTLNDLEPLFELISPLNKKILGKDELTWRLEQVNENIFLGIKNMTVSGEGVIALLSKGIPKEFQIIIDTEIQKSQIPSHLFNTGLPVTMDERELDNYLRVQAANVHTNFAEIVKKNSESLRKVPEKLKKLESLLLVFDFCSGISKFISNFTSFPEISEEFSFVSENLFLEKPQAVHFNLSGTYRCSILTGANSGGKTTLLEHILQLISLTQLGLPVKGQVKIPLFSEVYYFAKNKGSMSKGAFETLLGQMADIKPGKKTLILADEIEAVTEPGAASIVISATAEYFLSQDCFLVIATHLGQEIQKNLPKFTRIDGIEAKGLSEDFELIVDHNPVLGRLAHSTPELIVEKLAQSEKKEYFVYLFNKMKKI